MSWSAAGLVALVVTGLTLAPSSGTLAGLVALVMLVAAGWWLEHRTPVPKGDAPRVPTAYVVSPTVARDQLILLVVLAGGGLLILTAFALAAIGEGW